MRIKNTPKRFTPLPYQKKFVQFKKAPKTKVEVRVWKDRTPYNSLEIWHGSSGNEFLFQDIKHPFKKYIEDPKYWLNCKRNVVKRAMKLDEDYSYQYLYYPE
jgi:hypothetical protein